MFVQSQRINKMEGCFINKHQRTRIKLYIISSELRLTKWQWYIYSAMEDFSSLLCLFTTELSHITIITLQFSVFFLNTKPHDLLFANARCFSQLWQYNPMPLKLFRLPFSNRKKYEESYLPYCSGWGTEQLLKFLSSHSPALSQLTHLLW